jgi:hypothetical protein
LVAGCNKVFIDKASGKLARRPEMDKALLVARVGDQLVITRLDRLGRSLEHLIARSKELQAKGVELVVARPGHRHLHCWIHPIMPSTCHDGTVISVVLVSRGRRFG